MPLSSVVGAQSIVRPGVCTSSTKPASPYDGQVIYMTDVDQTAVWDGSAWVGLDPSKDRNMVINGDMRIDQRNSGAVLNPVGNVYTVDRWTHYPSQSGKLSFQQNQGSVTPPVGFLYYSGFTSLSAFSIATTDQFLYTQKIEGYNTAKLAWGTADAKTATLSFWVRSSLTGTFGGSIQNSAQNRCFPYSYTISSANTWEYKTVVIAGDTTGTWLTTNGIGARINFSLATGATYSGTAGAWTGTSYISSVTGAVSVVGTNAATWQVTGVQLEAGAVATPFEFEDYGTTFAKCQRYFIKSYNDGTAIGATGVTAGAATTDTTSMTNGGIFFGKTYYPTAMRTTPTVTTYSYSAGATGRLSNAGSGADYGANTATVIWVGANGHDVYNTSGANITSDYGFMYHYTASAEL